MRYSYSNVSTFGTCPYRWYLQYRERLKTIPETNADNALWLGLALHKGIETGSVEAALDEYKSHFNIITDAHVNYMMQLEYQLPRVFEILPPGGIHEVKVETDGFVGFIDYVEGDTLWDFKFSNNVDNYLQSPQLSIYKHYLEKVRPDLKINHLKFLFVPKVGIRQKLKAKPPETLQEFRARLLENLEATTIRVEEVEYDPAKVADFQECCGYLDGCTEFPKRESKLCGWCPYEAYCKRGEDWMLL